MIVRKIELDGLTTVNISTTFFTGCLHVPIVGPTGRSDPGYVRLSVRPVGQTGRTDSSRTALICQSHQCGLLADYNTAYAAA